MSRKSNRRNLRAAALAAAEEPQLRNARAFLEGPNRKHWSRHDLKNIKPLTHAQTELFHDFAQGKNIVGAGSAGTGKSFIALWNAFNEMFRPDSPYDRIIIVRTAVATRDLGHMPGDLAEKVALYENPYRDIVGDLFGRRSTYDDMKAAGKIEFMTTSYVRGLTWDNCIVVFDECQNASFHEIHSVVTRLGQDARILMVGDHNQTDLFGTKNNQSGFHQMLKIAERIPDWFSVVHFTQHDIVRGPLVKAWIMASEAA